MCYVKINSTHFGSTKTNTCEFYLVRPIFVIREDLCPRKFLALRYINKQPQLSQFSII